MSWLRNPPGVRPDPPSTPGTPPRGGSGVPQNPPNRGSSGKKEPVRVEVTHRFEPPVEPLADAVARYLRAIDGEGDPKSIRQAVDNLRAAHGRYEQAKKGTPHA